MSPRGCHGVVVRRGEEDACGKPARISISGSPEDVTGHYCIFHGRRALSFAERLADSGVPVRIDVSIEPPAAV